MDCPFVLSSTYLRWHSYRKEFAPYFVRLPLHFMTGGVGGGVEWNGLSFIPLT